MKNNDFDVALNNMIGFPYSEVNRICSNNTLLHEFFDTNYSQKVRPLRRSVRNRLIVEPNLLKGSDHDE